MIQRRNARALSVVRLCPARSPCMKGGRFHWVCVLLLLAQPGWAASEKLPEAFEKKVPETSADLQAIQKHVQDLARKVMPATVGIRIGPSSGSGVIIDAEGHVLTAGHVSG